MSHYSNNKLLCQNFVSVLERFSIECCKTKTKVFILAYHNWCKQPVNQSEFKAILYMYPVPSKGKHMRARYGWFWFYILLVQEVA